MISRYVIVVITGMSLACYALAQASADAYEPDDGAQNARLISGNILETDHSIYPAGDEDWFVVDLAMPATIVVEVNRRPANGGEDLRIRFLNDQLVELPCDDCESEGVAYDLPAGVFYIVLEEDTPGNTVPNYEVALSIYPHENDAFEPDDEMMNATPLVPGEIQRGHSIAPVADEDWFTFEVPNKGLDDSGTVIDAQTSVRNIGFTAFDESDNQYFLGFVRNRDFQDLPPGRYYLRVTEEGEEFAVPDYRIVTWQFPGADPYEADDTPQTASTMGVEGAEHTSSGQAQIRSIYPENDVDWIQFYVEDVTRAQIDVRGYTSFEPLIEVYDATGTTRLAGPIEQRLEFDDPPDGFYLLRLSFPGEFAYEPTLYDVEIATVPIPRLTQGALAGIVTADTKGTLISNATVSVSGRVMVETETGSGGEFLIPVLPQGTYAVEASADGYVPAMVQVNVGASVTAANLALAPLGEDLNGDNIVNAVDVQLVINSALGLRGPADVNNDGTTNAVDVQLVINAALGLKRVNVK